MNYSWEAGVGYLGWEAWSVFWGILIFFNSKYILFMIITSLFLVWKLKQFLLLNNTDFKMAKSKTVTFSWGNASTLYYKS